MLKRLLHVMSYTKFSSRSMCSTYQTTISLYCLSSACLMAAIAQLLQLLFLTVTHIHGLTADGQYMC